MLDVERPYHYPVPRFVKDLRLKEWRALHFGNERFYGMAALYDAKFFSLALITGWDKVARRRFGFRRILPGSAFRFGTTLDRSRIECRSHRTRIALDLDRSSAKARIRARSTARDAVPFDLFLEYGMAPRSVGPQAVCLPLGLNRAIFSLKILSPIQGFLAIGDERFAIGGPDAMGMLDEHRGFYPWRMHYDWVSGFGLDQKGRRVGFNLTDNQVRDQERYNENCLWINSRVFSLPPVRVTRPHGIMGVWIVQDYEGLVDLEFKPEVPNTFRRDLLLGRADYRGPFGSFKGVIKSRDGEKVELESLYGMGERKDLRI
ncbi:MAG: DUF2804 family protein [Spirochaetia bacterium]|nr:DUF2804 family protein [Spirochaetia bacterium]